MTSAQIDPSEAEKEFERESSAVALLRERCTGDIPLWARLEPWMGTGIRDAALGRLVEQLGSPLHVLNPACMSQHVNELRRVARMCDIDLKIYFARKANKCLAFVEQAIKDSVGVDVASAQELAEAIECGVSSEQIICTSAIKTRSLVEQCSEHDVTLVIDNLDELVLAQSVAEDRRRSSRIALRLGSFSFDGRKSFSRFGFDVDDLSVLQAVRRESVEVHGIHFHLSSTSSSDRVAAISQSLRWLRQLRQQQHPCDFIDIGGGFPVNFIDNTEQWRSFWIELSKAAIGERPPITFQNHDLGINRGGKGLQAISMQGGSSIYPQGIHPDRCDWLTSILEARLDERSLASEFRASAIDLRCEPGRSLLDGCGMTVARVEFRKRMPSGDWLVGCAMNHTNCRTLCDEFLVDPIVIPHFDEPVWPQAEYTGPMQGFFVGAYGTEPEFLSWRRFQFPKGIRRGDLVVFPNTAGYWMHFLESRSHRMPLPKNWIACGSIADGRLDNVDV